MSTRPDSEREARISRQAARDQRGADVREYLVVSEIAEELISLNGQLRLINQNLSDLVRAVAALANR